MKNIKNKRLNYKIKNYMMICNIIEAYIQDNQ
jgi:hypothetical protein